MRAIFLIFVFLAVGPLSIWLEDDLVSDYQLRGQKLTMANIPTSDRKCTGMPVLIYNCSYKFELEGKSHNKSHLLLAFGSPETIYLLKNQQTGVLTSSVGQGYFWNRVAAVFLFCVISFLTGLVLLGTLFRTSTKANPKHDPSPAVTPTTQDFRGNRTFGQR